MVADAGVVSEDPVRRRSWILAPVPPVDSWVRRVHIICLVLAGCLLLLDGGQHWFFADEWDFLVNRQLELTGIHGILYPHNEHWSTIPILIWRGIFSLVGVSDYWLYLAPLILAHLLCAHLLWRIMLRHRVDPWVATILAAAFMVLGVGWQNLTWAFQIAFVGSLAFGLLGVEAVENDRMWLPAVWGLGALMCSAVGAPMVVGYALVAAVRRRYKIALVGAVIPAVIYAIWWATISPVGTPNTHIGLKYLIPYIWTGLIAAASGFVGLPRFVGVVLVIVLALGALWRRNVPAVMAVMTVIMFAIIATGRYFFGANQAAASRYSYLAVALFLPLGGQLITSLVRLRGMKLLVLTALCVVVPVNVFILQKDGGSTSFQYEQTAAARERIQAAAYLIDHGAKFPGQSVPYFGLAQVDSLSVAQLTELIEHGQFPIPTGVNSGLLKEERASLSVYASPRPDHRTGLTFTEPHVSTSPPCGVLSSPVTVKLTSSGSLRLKPVPGVPVSSSNPAVIIVQLQRPGGVLDTTGYAFFYPGDRWLNLPSGYTIAVVSSYGTLSVCQG